MGGCWEEKGGADGGGAAGGIRHTNALYKRNELLLAAAGVRTGIGQPSVLSWNK